MYGLDKDSLNIQNYLSNGEQKTKMDSVYSYWEAIFSGVPQGSILRPLLFNIFICDMLLILKNKIFIGYANDNTPFVVEDNITDMVKALEEMKENLVSWFSNNQMELNTDKCHLLLNSQEPNALNDTYKEKASLNKTQVLTKSMNMDISSWCIKSIFYKRFLH